MAQSTAKQGPWAAIATLRRDRADGAWRTRPEFEAKYGGSSAEWERAEPVTSTNVLDAAEPFGGAPRPLLGAGYGGVAFALDACFSPSECRRLIAMSEAEEYSPALVNIGGGNQRLMADYRSSDRYMRDDVPLAGEIWARIAPHVPATLRRRAAVGLNERLRFLRYGRGGFFREHCDGVYIRPRGHPTNPLDRSQLTFLLYLNGGFEGGELAMDGGRGGKVQVKPSTGLVLVHDHSIPHEAMPVLSDHHRYCIRTDIMFSAEAEPQRAAAVAPPP